VGGSANNVINTMTVQGEDQVMLKVKVVEIQRKVLKEFGIDIAAMLQSGKFVFDLATANLGSATTQSYLTGRYNGSNVNAAGIIRALEGDGLVRTLAEPNLTALTGQAASFHAGGEFPYRLCTTDTTTNVRTCDITFKDYGIKVDFTPTVISEDRIAVKIKTDVSEIGEIVYDGIPSLNRRNTETALEIPSGGSMMIAGLISEKTRQNIDATPGLKKLPVLGALFRSHDFQTEETELVVIVTPVLVRPTTEKQLVVPDKNYNPPTDKQAVFLGRMNKIISGSDTAPDGAYHGDVGFIVE
jgi:pilus assembly protein CpaC